MMLFMLAMACSPVIPNLADPGGGDDDSALPGGGGTDGSGGDLVPDEEVEELPGVATDSDILFQDDLIQEFYLEISESGLDDLARDPYEYTEATLVFQGVSYGPIGIRTKGENSWRPFREKSSFKLDFNRYEGGPDRFLGMKGLTFQGMNEDYTMMHERVAYRMYREAGVPAARANHAVVYLNDELYGLFTVIDTVDDVFLKRWYDDASGSMWEQHDGDLTDQYVQDNLYFQHEEGEDDRWPLQALADALENSGDAAYQAADGIIEWDQFHRYWAASSVVMNFDAYPMRFAGDDCHVYYDVESERIHYFPHGVDESFYYDENFETRARGHIAAKCRESQTCRDAWANRVYDVLEISEDIDLAGYADYIRDQIEEYAEDDPERNYSMRDVRQQQEYMISRIQNRRSSVRGHIGERPE